MKEESESGQRTDIPVKKRLWTAPEILKNPNNRGTKEGDVYSFSIIVQEVVLEDTPFCNSQDFMEVKEIIEKVKASENPPFRPHLTAGDYLPFLHH